MGEATCTCTCHNGPHYPCDQAGGCGSPGGGCHTPTTGRCNSGIDCKAADPHTKQGCATRDPLCQACLDHAHRATTSLTYDYLDLAQLHEASLSQAINEKTAGSKEKTMLLVAHVEALQAEMVHVTTTWEDVLRAHQRLHNPNDRVPVAAWNTTLTRPVPPAKVRGGAAVQRAAGIIAPRLRALSLIEATAVCPTGFEDDHTDVAGWQAVHHLTDLHRRARSTLGRTRRTFWITGECWACDARHTPGVDGPLFRAEPRFEGDPMQVECHKCHNARPYADYEYYSANVFWPNVDTDALVRVAA